MSVKVRKVAGFTLIELMIVVSIIAVLAAVAFPAYTDYVIRSNRTDLQAHLMQLASNLERYKSQQLSYTGASLAMINNGSSTYPTGGTVNYNLALVLTPAAAPTQWTLTATPVGRQVGDGALQIDSQGRRCWDSASDVACDLTNPAQAWSSRSK